MDIDKALRAGVPAARSDIALVFRVPSLQSKSKKWIDHLHAAIVLSVVQILGQEPRGCKHVPSWAEKYFAARGFVLFSCWQMVPKLKDVALAAGVAINSASSILNGRKDSWASEATKARVFAAAKKLGYTPDRIARSLSTGKTRVAGLIVPNLSDPFFVALATVIGNELIVRDYDLVIEDTRLDYRREILCLDKINHWRFDGLMIAPISLDVLKSHLVPLAKRGTPVSVLGNHPKTATLGRIGVKMDQAIDEAFARLAALGHRRIGLLLHGQARHQSKIARVTKFEQALKKHHFDVAKPCVVNCDPTLESAHSAFRDLLQRTAARDLPTAFVCMNDLLAIGAMRAAAEAGLSVPRALSFIGVGDVPLGRYLPVGLSSIAEPLEEMARATVAQILNESPVEDIDLPATFVERESIGPAGCRTNFFQILKSALFLL